MLFAQSFGDWLWTQLAIIGLVFVWLLSKIPSSVAKSGAKWGFSELLKALFK